MKSVSPKKASVVLPKRYILPVRTVDRGIFLAMKDGTKSIETRAAKPRYMNVKKGDTLVIVCGAARIEKVVKKVAYFKSIAAITKAIPYKKINPAVSSIAELRRVYYSFPGYEEKIKEFGIVAWYL